jgi:hypothetical protein
MHRDILLCGELFLFVLTTDRTPELWTVGTVPITLSGNRENLVLRAVVLDTATFPKSGIATDDELFHGYGLANSALSDFEGDFL